MRCVGTAGWFRAKIGSVVIRQCISRRMIRTATIFQNTKRIDKKEFSENTQLSQQGIKSLPVSLQYFSKDITESITDDCENIEESLKMFDNTLEKIKFDIENLKALKSKFQEHQHELSKEANVKNYSIKSVLIGSADPSHPPSTVPCGGCGAFLHCNDPALPGYIPQQKFKGKNTENLAELLCTRCTLLKSSNEIIQMEIDKRTYAQILKKIRKEFALVLMVVDVTDMANSILPEFLHDIGTKRPIFVVGNKIDLIPKDSEGYLKGILHRLELECERALLNPSGKNIKHTCLVSAKTGYGIEKLISKLIKDWHVDGNMYMVGTTNSGKSSLFNRFLESDYCKHTCRDIVQRATVSRWPGTTLNLIKFPIIRADKKKMYLRNMRLSEDIQGETERIERRKANLKSGGKSYNAVLVGNVGKTDFRNEFVKDEEDKKYETSGHHFTAYSFENTSESIATSPSLEKGSVLSYQRTILEDMYPGSKWACDTPGLINNNQIINKLTAEELKKILKVNIIRPRVFVMKPGDVMFITGLARIDYLEGEPRTYFTVHTNHFLPVHVVYSCNADSFYNKNVGTENLGVPSGDCRRLEMLPSLCGREFYMETEEQNIAVADLQLSSLGWVSFAAGQETPIHIRAYTPAGRGMHLRTPALLPDIRAFKGRRIGEKKEFAMKKLKS